MHEACHISLKISKWGLQLCFKPCFNQRFAQEVVGVQNGEIFNFKNFGTPDWGLQTERMETQPSFEVFRPSEL